MQAHHLPRRQCGRNVCPRWQCGRNICPRWQGRDNIRPRWQRGYNACPGWQGRGSSAQGGNAGATTGTGTSQGGATAKGGASTGPTGTGGVSGSGGAISSTTPCPYECTDFCLNAGGVVMPGTCTKQGYVCCNVEASSASSTATGTQYFIDATSGDDNNDGSSEAKAWKSLTRIKGAGVYNLKRGSVWTSTGAISLSNSTMRPYGTGLVLSSTARASSRPLHLRPLC